MADKPHRDHPRAGAPTGDVLPSWQRSTEPESRWPAFAAVVIIIAGQTWVASSLSLRPVWLLPVVAGILLVASVAVYIPSRTEPSRALRMLSLGLVAVLVIADIVSLVLLVRGVFVGSQLNPPALLLAGAALWVVNVAVFALMYWELDGGGPEARADGYRDYPDLVFPQQQQDQQGLAPADWKPTFPDYLFVSLTSATAFSPTDGVASVLGGSTFWAARRIMVTTWARRMFAPGESIRGPVPLVIPFAAATARPPPRCNCPDRTGQESRRSARRRREPRCSRSWATQASAQSSSRTAAG